MYLELFIISLLVCFVVDFSGFIEEMEGIIKRRLQMPFFHIGKPLSCSLCMTWWIGLFYLLVMDKFTILNIGYVAALAGASSIFTSMMFVLKDMCDKIIEWLSRL